MENSSKENVFTTHSKCHHLSCKTISKESFMGRHVKEIQEDSSLTPFEFLNGRSILKCLGFILKVTGWVSSGRDKKIKRQF